MNKLFRKEMPILVDGLKKVHKKFANRFDMRTWSSQDNGTPSRSPKCNTSGCAMGWKNSFIKDSPIKCIGVKIGKDWKGNDEWELGVRYKNFEEFEAISKAYGITEDQAQYLFHPNSYSGWDANPTALEVAHRIETVLYDGFPESCA
jgi:hypothetical protein